MSKRHVNRTKLRNRLSLYVHWVHNNNPDKAVQRRDAFEMFRYAQRNKK